MNDDLDTSAEACAVACMLVSNPAGETRHVGWQKQVNDLTRALLAERDDYKKTAWEIQNDNARLRAELAKRDELLKEARDFIIRHGQGDFYTINGIVERIDAELAKGGRDE